jgi:CRISPR-associated endonuclease/helicase Cas3
MKHNGYLSFWGKSAHNSLCPEQQWHPAAFHMLDVAAVAETWLADTRLVIPGLGEAWRESVPALVGLVALHDVGKFSRSFQAKV